VKPKRSPLFYVGDKYKLMPQLLKFFPDKIDSFIDVFAGGGSVSLNTKAKKYVLNDNNLNIVRLHRFLLSYESDFLSFRQYMYGIIDQFNLSCSERRLENEIIELKKNYKKTYFSKYNKAGYLKLRDSFNNNKECMEYLYILLIYGFNHMVRFNKVGNFNLPVGNVDWNKNVSTALENYFAWRKNDITIYNTDFIDLLDHIQIDTNDFCYFDPPYIITNSEYNVRWSEYDEIRLYNCLDNLSSRGIKWGLSNMLNHKGRSNKFLAQWASQYNMYDIQSNYISKFDNTIKMDSREVYVTNIGRT
jgi:DNA adenine methylase (dam)